MAYNCLDGTKMFPVALTTYNELQQEVMFAVDSINHFLSVCRAVDAFVAEQDAAFSGSIVHYYTDGGYDVGVVGLPSHKFIPVEYDGAKTGIATIPTTTYLQQEFFDRITITNGVTTVVPGFSRVWRQQLAVLLMSTRLCIEHPANNVVVGADWYGGGTYGNFGIEYAVYPGTADYPTAHWQHPDYTNYNYTYHKDTYSNIAGYALQYRKTMLRHRNLLTQFCPAATSTDFHHETLERRETWPLSSGMTAAEMTEINRILLMYPENPPTVVTGALHTVRCQLINAIVNARMGILTP